MTAPIYPRIAVVGCGLIGGSVVRAARQAGAAGHVSIYDASAEVRARVRELGIGDSAPDDIVETVRDADLILFATPPLSIGAAAAAAASAMKPGATVTDVGSIKGAVAQALAEACPDHVFVVPGHPISGTEQSGPDAGFAELLHHRWTILTPQPREDEPYLEAVQRLADFWAALGAKVERMDEKHHDLVLAVTSHLPHLIAYNIVGTADDLADVTKFEVMKYSAGGFRDFTRIAASDPVMWRDVFLGNRDAVLEILGRFTEDLQALQRHIRRGEGEALQALFTRTRELRRGIVAAGQESAEPNFGRDRGKH
jgi:cyclohexadieny/prephenate dehydrogenase